MLAETLPERTRGWVVDQDGWVLAGAGARTGAGVAANDAAGAGGAMASLGARMLGIDTTEAGTTDPLVRLTGDARGTEPTARWLFDTEARQLRVRARAPLDEPSQPSAFVVLERNADRFMTSAHAALMQLFVLGLAAVAVLGGALVSFAGLLSRRIRRLRDAVEAAVSRDGRVIAGVPATGHRDELGELARDIATLTERQRQHQDYLDSLAGKLSHELRTPLAMIRSSLDNLAESEDPEERERFRARAEDGCQRLQRTFEAMSQANRIERSLEREPLDVVDIAALVDRYCEGCRETFSSHEFAAVVPVRREARVLGSPEQLAQMLDKLIENAVDFTPPGARITLRVVPRGRVVAIQVDNPGSRLPRNLDGTLFDSMVSGRGAAGASHLGLGLYIVRLIAERHRGRVRAMELDDGCRLEVELPRARADQDSR
jgi:signal transduction histidine kinase